MAVTDSPLSADALALMPDPDSAPKCAEHARSIGTDPGGTAVSAALIVFVETPLPWPKPVFEHQLLAGMTGMFDTRLGAARLFATLPDDTDAFTRVITYWREPESSAQVHGLVHQAGSPDELRQLMETITVDHPTESVFVEGPAPETILAVCTQGSHDVCCGTEGTRFAAQIAERFPDIGLLRVSHTGGHRFAPTALTFPGGRMWADLEPDDVAAIVHRAGSPADIAQQCRGWWVAPTGPGQVAERALFATQGWDWDDRDRSVAVADPNEAGETAVTVTAGHDQWLVTVVPGRSVPTLKCRAPGGLPAKPGREYAVRSIESR